jgi:hypothetical protein
VGPERLLSLFQDWFATQMDLVYQPVVTTFQTRAPRGWVCAIDDQIATGQRISFGLSALNVFLLYT